MVQEGESYPVQFSVDYPDRELDRFSSFFRLLTAIPIGFVLSLVTGTSWLAAGGLLSGGPLVMILFRQKYPRW